ncbi:Fc receptor-like A isoform X1 [Pteropus medius]|uniref:Fc receptor-like A isoform X1 n=1 Tax=Pteropus vampyrus TaxID=132908 RepID=UPI00196B3408|nr:Fc receptor-like A isoform X1 [Pteropus giganteus]
MMKANHSAGNGPRSEEARPWGSLPLSNLRGCELERARAPEATGGRPAVTMKQGGVLTARVLSGPAVLWAARVLLAAGCHAAVALEMLQCEGPVSTQDSSCHTASDVTGPRDSDFQVKGYTFSKPFHLIVSYDWLILQSPAMPMFEGDPLVLRCQAWQDWPLTQVTFYRDGAALGPPGPSRELPIAALRKADSGHYHCSAMFRGPGPGSLQMASPVAVAVQDLFPDPVLRASPSAEPREGAAVTLSCRTQLRRERPAGRLLFAFYKGGGALRGWGPSSELQMPAATAAHSGSYWCEATTEGSRVWKRSPELEVRVQGPSSSAAPPASKPAPQKPAAPGTPAVEPPGPQPPPPVPSSVDPAPTPPLQALDPHLLHQMRLLLKQMQDVQALLGHLVTELRDLSGHLKLETTKGRAEHE